MNLTRDKVNDRPLDSGYQIFKIKICYHMINGENRVRGFVWLKFL